MLKNFQGTESIWIG